MWDLPNRFVEHLDVIWDLFYSLNGTIISDQLVLDIRSPKIEFDQIFDEVLIYADELSSQYSSSVYIGSERLEAFIIAKHLGSGGSWHWGNQQGVSGTMLHHIFSKRFPIVSV